MKTMLKGVPWTSTNSRAFAFAKHYTCHCCTLPSASPLRPRCGSCGGYVLRLRTDLVLRPVA